MAGAEGVYYVMTELSATDAWHGAAVADAAYISLISTVCEVNF